MAGVMTSLGSFPAQVLRERDRVLTKSGQYLPITVVRRMTFDADYLGYHPGAQPILIRTGALARGVPAADVLLAPYQKIHPEQTFCKPGLKLAIDALQQPHVCRKPESMITYTTISFGRPATICCDGLWIDVAA
jgi:Hint domain-containing protein